MSPVLYRLPEGVVGGDAELVENREEGRGRGRFEGLESSTFVSNKAKACLGVSTIVSKDYQALSWYWLSLRSSGGMGGAS